MILSERSRQVRRDAIKLMREYELTHYGGSFSCAEILIAMYDHILTLDDMFILSKGHGCSIYYVLLREGGLDPVIEGHPHRDVKNGIYATTGSLGHGLPFGIGIALAKKLKKESGRVYVLCGDGELEEGTFYESLLLAAHYNLDNLVIFVDANEIQGSDFLYKILNSPYEYVAQACGWWTNAIDGHNIEEIVDSTKWDVGSPQLIRANTIKGQGVSFMREDPSWHSHWLNDEDMKKALGELA